jgi:hypothetical protein
MILYAVGVYSASWTMEREWIRVRLLISLDLAIHLKEQ